MDLRRWRLDLACIVIISSEFRIFGRVVVIRAVVLSVAFSIACDINGRSSFIVQVGDECRSLALRAWVFSRGAI
jgi:hypothetical protein